MEPNGLSDCLSARSYHQIAIDKCVRDSSGRGRGNSQRMVSHSTIFGLLHDKANACEQCLQSCLQVLRVIHFQDRLPRRCRLFQTSYLIADLSAETAQQVVFETDLQSLFHLWERSERVRI